MLTDQTTETLPDTAYKQHLLTIAPVIVTACPDLHEEAHVMATEILKKHGITGLDPDQVWWHRFGNVTASSTQAFLGWEHYPKPSQSMTLTQLVIHRYYVTDQDYFDQLDCYGGFYTADATASIYNETNEVRMYPSAVLKDFWHETFSDRYRDKLNAYWSAHFDDYRTLAKCNYLSKAVEARENGTLQEEEFQTVIRAVAADKCWPISLETLRAQTSAPTDLRVCALDVAGHVATDILRIDDGSGRQITYVPGATEAFHVHPTLTDMHWWILLQMNDDARYTEFMTHFPLSVRQEIHDNITPLMNQLVGTWGKYDHHLINQKNITISGDAFSWLSRNVQSAMSQEADLSLVTNGQLRKGMWLGYLSAGLHVFGPLALLGWPIALPVIGASIASMGLNIDKAVNGKTVAERKAGVKGAVLAGINLLFNLPLLKEVDVLEEVGASAEAAEAAEMARLREANNPAEPIGTQEQELSDGSGRATTQLPEFIPLKPAPAQNLEVPEHWQSNEILESEAPLATSGKFQGIYSLNSNPSTAIMMNDAAYYVRYEADINGGGTWAIIDPANPYASTGSIPVRLNAEGEWELTSKSGLKGGGKDDLAAVPGPSRFPDHVRPPEALRVPSTKYDTSNGRSLNFLGLGKKETHIKIINLPNGRIQGVTPYEEFVAGHRTALLRDARAFFSKENFFASLPARPVQPVITPSMTVPELIQEIFDASPGLVIGEGQDRIASMRFLIENMQTLARQGVKTIYMHRLLNDFNQMDLNIFGRSATMDGMLEKYLKQLQSDPAGQFTPLEVVKVARENGIRIQATDCLTSYRYPESSFIDVQEQSIKNYLTTTIMRANEALGRSGKWVVLTGQENTNTFRGIAGLSEMNGGIGLRIEEVLPERSLHIEIDHGIEVGRNASPPPVNYHGDFDTLYADISLQVPMPMLQRTPDEIARLLFRQGMFTFKESDGTWTLIHRSRTNLITETLVERTADGQYLVNRPAWTDIHQKPYPNLISLSHALTGMGMKLEGRLPV
ncbi:membrane-targeted effector domain-containing toxin [Pseudomonas sp. FP1740]|uniref:membrane-targeted effector domain-containing toxin n=1 Tax=Pseudomonas sp. FP1740 TaxID=2954078 RepID=UPI002733260A|nr:membrane-targeted effector domain-containing toxin [Pseudomonas sp. FP1740]WLG43938.1 membrane-targeted effector domain-containing toxin [Pseudomonas sp. FP1740]